MSFHNSRANPSALFAVFVFALGGLIAFGQERVPFPENNRRDLGFTRSDGGEFKVIGLDAFTRGSYCDYAVSTRKDFQKLLNFGGDLKFPVIIKLKKVPGNRIRGRAVQPIAITSPKYSPNIEVKLCESFRQEDLRRELTSFFLMDYALRRHREAGEIVHERVAVKKQTIIPDWLLAGVTEAIGFKQNGEPSELFAAVFQSGKIMSVDEILVADPGRMNSLSSSIYRASAGGLVLTLLQQDGGTARMRNFISALVTAPQDQQALLRKYFPGVDESNNSLEKWWALQAAELAKPTTLDVLPIKETEQQLERALRISVMEGGSGGGDRPREPLRPFRRLFSRDGREPDTAHDSAGGIHSVAEQRVVYTLEEFEKFARRDDIEEILSGSKARLQQLSFRSFPLYRPLISDYLEMIEQIIEGKTKGLEERFARLAETRVGLARSGRMAEDVMNLQSVTESDQSSGEFDEYFRLFERLRSVKPKRSDEISDYLDRIQAEYE